MYMKSAARRRTGSESLGGDWSQVVALVSTVDGQLSTWLADSYRLGLTEYRALLLLSRAPDKELRVNDLAHRVGLNQSSVTRLLGRLEAKNLSHRETCPQDGRGVYAVISERGLELVRQIRPVYEKKLAAIIANGSDDDYGLDPQRVSQALATIQQLLT